MRALAAVAIACALACGGGCRGRGPSSRAPSATPLDDVPYRDGPLDPDVKVLLVAGGDDIANFAAEVVEQRALWLQAGLQPDEIACYWAKPRPRAWQRDREQYAALQGELRGCYAATAARVLGDLRELAARRPAWVYLFVTAHGLDSIAGLWKEDAGARKTLAALPRDLQAALDVPAIALQGDPARRIEDAPAIAKALQGGVAGPELLFTPAFLGDALAAFPAATRKFAVLQGCYSGGFVREDKVAAVERLVVLTASAHDRPSFGCGSGDARTWWGGAFNRVLARVLEPGRTPVQLDWRRIHEEVAFVIDVMEAIDGERPSKPVYFESGR